MPREGRGSMPCRGGGEGAMSLRRTRLRAQNGGGGGRGRGGTRHQRGPPGSLPFSSGLPPPRPGFSRLGGAEGRGGETGRL